MKIAISGSACCGKTTLAHSLSQAMDSALIPEQYDGFFDHSGRYIQPRNELMELIEGVLDNKHQQEDRHTRFIADRSPIDLFNLWLSLDFSVNKKRTNNFQQKCKVYLKKYDLIILPPWGALPMKQVSEAHSSRKRVMKPWVQFRHHSTLIGIALQWLPVNKLLPIPSNIIHQEQRLSFILKSLE
ncbi:MAG: AAA family ATPase [Sedimenticola sp.]